MDSCNTWHLAATVKQWRNGPWVASLNDLVCVPEPAFDKVLPLASCVIERLKSNKQRKSNAARKGSVQRWMQQVEQLPHCSKVRYAFVSSFMDTVQREVAQGADPRQEACTTVHVPQQVPYGNLC